MTLKSKSPDKSQTWNVDRSLSKKNKESKIVILPKKNYTGLTGKISEMLIKKKRKSSIED